MTTMTATTTLRLLRPVFSTWVDRSGAADVASHKNPALDDDPRAIEETRSYLEDSERLSRICHSALDFYNAMMELYPNRLNPTALWFWGALALFPAAANA